MSTAVAEQFPTASRSTGLGIGYNVAVAVFGGFAPFFVTWLIGVTGSPIAPAYYVMFGATVGLVGTFFLVESSKIDRLFAKSDALPSRGVIQE